MEFRLLKMSGNNVMAQISGKPPTPQNRQVGDVGAILNFIGGSAGSDVDSRIAQFVMSWAKDATPGEEIFVEYLGGKWVVT